MIARDDLIIILGSILCGMSFQQNLMFFIGIVGMVLVIYGAKQEPRR